MKGYKDIEIYILKDIKKKKKKCVYAGWLTVVGVEKIVKMVCSYAERVAS